jgi:hypothetical protein
LFSLEELLDAEMDPGWFNRRWKELNPESDAGDDEAKRWNVFKHGNLKSYRKADKGSLGMSTCGIDQCVANQEKVRRGAFSLSEKVQRERLAMTAFRGLSECE